METKTEAITRYIKSMVSFLDGNGLVVTDWDLIEEVLKECGDFVVLKDIVNKEEN
jgi:hypothetical protein